MGLESLINFWNVDERLADVIVQLGVELCRIIDFRMGVRNGVGFIVLVYFVMESSSGKKFQGFFFEEFE